jgi:NADH:ubiquinone oxidoreductase subunit 5 (subunit L)/multisubunit Na+/H+ antiporter MnhA subunit
MFMSAGLLYKAYGHDRIADLAGAARAVPLSVLAFVIGGVALMGVLPSGAYLAKKLLQSAAESTGQWWWYWVLQAGGFLTTSYVVLVAAHAFGRRSDTADPPKRVPRLQEGAALFLALCSLALALVAVAGPLPGELLGNPLAPKELGATLVTVAIGSVLALTLARRLPGLPAGMLAFANPARRAMLAIGGVLERIDTILRQWAVAGLSLLILALVFGMTMRAG